MFNCVSKKEVVLHNGSDACLYHKEKEEEFKHADQPEVATVYTGLDDFLKKLFEAIAANPATEVVVDLEQQTVSLNGMSEHFEINTYKKTCMINGYDHIDYLLSLNDEIRQFDLAHS